MGIFLVCIGFLVISFLSLALPDACTVDSTPEVLDFVGGNDGGLAAAEVFEDSLSLA